MSRKADNPPRHRRGLALAALVALMALPASASADHPGEGEPPAAEVAALGPEHAAEHEAQRLEEARARERYERASPKRRRQLRRAERARYRESVRQSADSAAAYPPQTFGQWTTPGGEPFKLEGASYAIHATLLPTGKVMFWGYPDDPGSGKPNTGEAAIWDPAAPDPTAPEAFTAVPPMFDITGDGVPESVPLYCSGGSYLPSGEILVAGGNLTFPDHNEAYDDFAGIKTVLTFDPFSQTWAQQPDMRQGRWYPSQLELADGRTLIVGGYNQRPPGGLYNRDVELFTPGKGLGSRGKVERLRNANRKTQNYPHLFTLPDGRALLAGPGRVDSAILNRKFRWRNVGKANEDRIGGTATLLPQGPKGSSKVLQLGGFPAGRIPATATESAEQIKASKKKPKWRSASSLNINRANHNTVLLPDGSMVTVGGGTGVTEAEGNYANVGTERRQVELWDPQSGRWRLGPPQVEDRTYHSVALLLPDGRVWSAGDDRNPTQTFGDGTIGFSSDDTGEIYSPPYLFAADGSPIAAEDRPQIIGGPSSLRYDKRFRLSTGGPAARQAVLVAPSSVTHAANMTQRVVPLRGDGSALRSPPNSKIAPPGRYMLFVLDSRGVPSVAKWVKLR